MSTTSLAGLGPPPATPSACEILALGLNHRTAPVEVRERAAFAAEAQPAALSALVREYGASEAALLSTCNRCELYLVSGPDALTQARRFLTANRGLPPAALDAHYYALRNAEAAAHLFRVACGIDSLVVGESQILSQVRDAMGLARRTGSAGVLVNELFQRALHVGKRARAETDIGRGRLSIGTAAVELAGQIFGDLGGCAVLLVGAGDIGELTAQYLLEAPVRQLLVTNRTDQRAVELAGRIGGVACPYAQMPDRLAEVDIVVCATTAPGFVIGFEALERTMRARRGRPLFLIDIAVPRDVDPAGRSLDNVFLFDIDDLEQVVAAHRAERDHEIQRVGLLIDEELEGFQRWLGALQAGPLIRALKDRAGRLQEVELLRWAGKLEQLTPAQRQLVEGILRGYANKLLHAPLVQIRQLAAAPDGYARLAAVRELFGLAQAGEQTAEESP